jgi:hypothetical protein
MPHSALEVLADGLLGHDDHSDPVRLAQPFRTCSVPRRRSGLPSLEVMAVKHSHKPPPAKWYAPIITATIALCSADVGA